MSAVHKKETREERVQRMISVFKDTMSMIEGFPALGEAVKRSIEGTKCYSPSDNPAVERNRGKQLKVSVTANRSFQAARELSERNPGKRVAVLNFASATSPGGGVKHGSSAQEESLCRCSTLYPVLNRDELRRRYYSFHIDRKDHLYTDSCIYSPEIRIVKTDVDHPERLPENQWISVDVITCAAPCFRWADPLPDQELAELHLRRGRKILDAALENGVDCLVLGAFGCGAFRNDPEVVAKVYAQLMDEYKNAFDEIEFAVFYWGAEVANYEAFKEALG